MNLQPIVDDLRRAGTSIQQETDRAVAAKDHVALIRHFDKVRNITEQIKEAREALDQIETRLSREYVPEAMREAGVRTITVEGVGRVSVSQRWSASILDKELGHKWLQDNGHGGLIIPTVNASSLSAFAKNLIEEEGKELPEDLFKTGRLTYTSITKK